MAKCTFRKQITEEGVWECLTCHLEWILSIDGPKENDMHYCPKCGAKITKLERTVYDAENDEMTIMSEDYK